MSIITDTIRIIIREVMDLQFSCAFDLRRYLVLH